MAFIIWWLGIAGLACGIFTLFHDSILYLQGGTWVATSSFAPLAASGWFEHLPRTQAALEATPLWLGASVLGLLLLGLGGRLRRRYD